MKRNIIITAGPTNEPIDAVMQITNMSTGALGNVIAETFLEDKADEIGKIYYISPKMSYKPRFDGEQVELVTVKTTQDLIDALKDIFSRDRIDIIVHSSAVGDYTGEYVVRAEDLAHEIYGMLQKAVKKEEITEESIVDIFRNPECVCNNSTKISSYEPNLMVKMGLTPKVISLIKQMAPNVTLVGFKLLEGVSKEYLYQVASKLREKNDADYIVANDLAKIGGGKHWAMILNKDGIVTECQTKKEIAKALEALLF